MRETLEKKTVDMLTGLARKLKVPSFSTLSKDALIEAMLVHDTPGLKKARVQAIRNTIVVIEEGVASRP